MTPETLEALKGSIKKWEAIVDGTGEDTGANNCPLCQLFAHGDTPLDDVCKGCPVEKATGHTSCHNSPYSDWLATVCDPEHDQPSLAAAQAELDFLRSLLPKPQMTGDI